MGRRTSRGIAMKLLYQLEIQKEGREKQIKTVLEESVPSQKDKEYINEIISGVFNNISYIDKLIEKYSKGWKINRISKVNLSILRLSIFEILFRDDIPYSVSINEAVELAKKYSGDDSGSFINGILSKISKAGGVKTEDQVDNLR
jgi:N utilization substance protein B